MATRWRTIGAVAVALAGLGLRPALGEEAGGARLAAAEPAPTAALPEASAELRTFAAPWQSRPTLARIAIIDASGQPDRGGAVAVLLMDLVRYRLERRIGMRIDVVNVAAAPDRPRPRTVIHYRPGFLRAALALAEVIPGDQAVEPMTPAQLEREGIDVELWLGRDAP